MFCNTYLQFYEGIYVTRGLCKTHGIQGPSKDRKIYLIIVSPRVQVEEEGQLGYVSGST